MKAGAPLIVASHNAGKVREILELLAPFGFDVKGAGSLGFPSPRKPARPLRRTPFSRRARQRTPRDCFRLPTIPVSL